MRLYSKTIVGICTGSLPLLRDSGGTWVDRMGAWARGSGSLVVPVAASNGSALPASVCPSEEANSTSVMGACAATTVTSPGPLMALSWVWLSPTLRTSPPPSNEASPRSPSTSLTLLGGREPWPSRGLTGVLDDWAAWALALPRVSMAQLDRG